MLLLVLFMFNSYDLDWYNLTVKTQKLLILILIRSNKPCFLTAGKIYVVSMENFGSVGYCNIFTITFSRSLQSMLRLCFNTGFQGNTDSSILLHGISAATLILLFIETLGLNGKHHFLFYNEKVLTNIGFDGTIEC